MGLSYLVEAVREEKSVRTLWISTSPRRRYLKIITPRRGMQRAVLFADGLNILNPKAFPGDSSLTAGCVLN